jgi:hypothetical protein
VPKQQRTFFFPTMGMGKIAGFGRKAVIGNKDGDGGERE